MKLILSCGEVKVGVLRWSSQLLMNVVFTGVNGTSIAGAQQPVLMDIMMQKELPGILYFPDPSQI